MKYRKKPVVIEAFQTDKEMIIHTLEGDMKASVGDFIITGVNGERYPCKPNIFENTYELVESEEAKQPDTSKIENILHGKSAEEQYDFLWWLMQNYGMQFTDTRMAVIEWLRGERGEYSHTLVGELVRCEDCINAPECGHFVISLSRGGEIKFHHLSYCSYGGRRTDDEAD